MILASKRFWIPMGIAVICYFVLGIVLSWGILPEPFTEAVLALGFLFRYIPAWPPINPWLIQCFIYGVVIGNGWSMNKLKWFLTPLIIIHLVAIILKFVLVR